MGRQCRDGGAEVKKHAQQGAGTRWRRMRKAAKWLGLTLGVAILTIGVGLQWRDRAAAHSAAATFAARPLNERNLAVFDAACHLLEKHYFNAQYMQGEQWLKSKTQWRAKAAANELFLYRNVLDNLAHSFPESHVGFIDPPVPDAPKQPAASPASSPHKNIDPRLWDAWKSGPGYSAATVFRAGSTRDTVSEVLRGSPAERAGVTPGWLVIGARQDLNTERALFSADFLTLSSEQQHALELHGSFPGVKNQQEADDFIKSHTA